MTTLKTLSHFDFVERNYGFFKYQQENLHKSNIYSINLSNTGLNPDNDYNSYTKEQVIERLLSPGVPSSDNDFIGHQISSELNHMNFYFKYNETNDSFYYVRPFDLNFDTTFNAYCISSFAELHTYVGWEQIPNTNLYTFKNETYQNIIQKKRIMRNILEDAIKKSVAKWMPADTTLWKIKYTGK